MKSHFFKILLFGLALLLLGCQSTKIHIEGEGPLMVKGTGGFALWTKELGEPPWYYTSFFHPCVNSSRVKEIEILSIDYLVNEEVPPLDVFVLRRDVKNTENDVTLLGGEYSGLPRYLDQENGIPIVGKFSEDVNGIKVRRPCSDEMGRDSFTDFAIVSKSDKKGMQIKSVVVHYLADGKPYSVESFWEMTICGEAISDLDICREEND